MRPLAVRIRGLSRSFGDVRALDGIDLSVPEGSVYGFLGPNGAGKTTTLRIVSGLARSDEGDIHVLGHDLSGDGASARAETGYLPDVPGFYPWMTGEEFLRFAGSLFGLDRATLDERVPSLLVLAGLADVTNKVGGYSRGMRQRLGIAQALVNVPRLLLLDEPTSALDPMGRRDVLDMIASLRGKTTVLFSTHILGDVERVCDHVGILSKGRVVAEGPLAEVRMPAGTHRFAIEVAGGAARLAEVLEGMEWARGVSLDGDALALDAADPAAARRGVPAEVARLGLELVRFETLEVSLEEVFIGLVGEGGGGS